MNEPDYKLILLSFLRSLALADHMGDAYGYCYRVVDLCGLMEGYDPEAEYFYESIEDEDPIEPNTYDHFVHFLEKEKGALCLWELEKASK